MKWVTRQNAKVDRIACPWLIRRFIDENAEFLYVPVEEVLDVAEREAAIPYDVSGVELGHVDGRCSFESLLLKFDLTANPALAEMGRIVHAADVSADVDSALEGWGLKAIAHGFSLVFGTDDHRKLELEMPLYDALYAWCQHKLREFLDERDSFELGKCG
jgi:hypothetical protein